ncbi:MULTISPECIES: hypothetical protein [Bradyrhizobium]|uniref:hypothetical protein n=1 Tax=Bradyrhizobium elkanii TaxID=29448 RepID=UPI0003FE8872|nr:hypothetical protein [Bradyrhizobium elkanii]
MIDSRITELLSPDQEFPQFLLVIPDKIADARIVIPARTAPPCSMRNSERQLSAVASRLVF